MARKSLLSAAIPQPQTTANQNEQDEPAAPPVSTAAVPRKNSNAGKYHVGGYFTPDDPTAEAFRILAAKTRRTQQDLLAEALADLVAKYDAQAKFSS